MDAKTEHHNEAVNPALQISSVTPTRQGVMYLVVNLILFLTAINYSNHNILVVALFLLSLFAVSLVAGVRAMRGLRLSVGEIRPVFQGQELTIPLWTQPAKGSENVPVDIRFTLDSGQKLSHFTRLAVCESRALAIPLSLRKRGRYKLINAEIASTFPFGLIRLRRSFSVSASFWIYPKPTETGEGKSMREINRGQEVGDEMFLRQYRLGDPVRRIHKKSLAMGQTILVKDMEAKAPDLKWLQWESVPDLATEQRLQVLTRQVLDAEQQGKTYGLVLPNGKINPAAGEPHKHQCLRLLAEV